MNLHKAKPINKHAVLYHAATSSKRWCGQAFRRKDNA